MCVCVCVCELVCVCVCVCVCAWVCAWFWCHVLCVCTCLGQVNNQEEVKMKTTSQQGKKIIDVPMNGFEHTPSCL